MIALYGIIFKINIKLCIVQSLIFIYIFDYNQQTIYASDNFILFYRRVENRVFNNNCSFNRITSVLKFFLD